MSLREQLEASVTQLEEAHEKCRLAYRSAISARNEAEKAVRSACSAASDSANELGAVKKALEEFNRNTPVVEAEGEVGN